MSEKVTYQKLANMYGYDEKSIRRWANKGMPTSSYDDAQYWIVENIITPLREENSDTDLDEQIKRERLKLLQIESEQKELEYQRVAGSVIDTEFLRTKLSEDFKRIKDTLRSIPRKYYLELFENKSAPDLRDQLQDVIDQTLTEIVMSFTQAQDVPDNDEED